MDILKNYINLLTSTLTLLSLMLLFNTSVQAQSSSDDLVGFDGIIKELSTGSKSRYLYDNSNPFDNILIHAGIGLVTSHISLAPNGIKEVSGFHKGIEATLGIDLFSKYWKAEGSVRSFGDEKISDFPVSLKEFDLKIVYEDYVRKSLKYSIGFGLAARYLDITYEGPLSADEIISSAASSALISEKHTTPSSLISVGASTYISKGLSLGVEFSYRSALISETIDKSAFDALVRIDTHF
jgi:hypothetical protein